MISTRHAPNAWVRIPEPRPKSRLRLFCFPYAGVGISAFRGWADLLGPDIEVCLVQLPGREDRLSEPCFRRLPDMMAPLLAALRPYLDRPFAFFGHSMGGLISFELTRALEHGGGLTPSSLVISARRAPQLADTSEPIHALPDETFILQIGRLYDGIPPAILANQELRDLLLPTLRADLELCETYTYLPQAPLRCPILAFGGRDDPLVSRHELDSWRGQSAAGFTLIQYAGGHFFLREARSEMLNVVAATTIANSGQV